MKKEYTKENSIEYFLRVKALLNKFTLWYDTERYLLVLRPKANNKAKDPFKAIKKLFEIKIKKMHWCFDIDKNIIAYVNERFGFMETPNKTMPSCPPNGSCAVVSFKDSVEGWLVFEDDTIYCDGGTDKSYGEDKHLCIEVPMQAISSRAVSHLAKMLEITYREEDEEDDE